MNAAALLFRFGLCLVLFLFAAVPGLSARSARKARAPHVFAALANPGPAPVILDGKIPLPPDVPPAPILADASSYVLMDFATGTVIAAKAPHLRLPPASLTKLMTVYLTYRAVKTGTVHMDRSVEVSPAAWREGGSRMFIDPATPVTIKDLISGLMIDSGNDAAVALAQSVAGTRASFTAMMNHEAALLHLDDTHYADVDGLPDPGLYTSALDVARLSREIIREFPEILKISKQQTFTYDNITQRNWNPVVFRDSSVDGLKTGLTKESGHCIDATARRGERRLIAVVMGGPSWRASADDIEALLDYGYRFFENRTVMTAGEAVGAIDSPLLAPIHVPVGPAKTVVLTVPASKKLALGRSLHLDPVPEGRIAKGAVVGTVAIDLDGKTFATVPAVALLAAAPAGLGQRLIYKIKRLL